MVLLFQLRFIVLFASHYLRAIPLGKRKEELAGAS